MNYELQEFRQQIGAHYNLDDLRELVFDLSMDWEELSGTRKSTIITDLIIQVNLNNRLPELITLLSSARPQLNWPSPTLISAQIASNPTPFVDTRAPLNEQRQNLINNMRQAWIDGLLNRAIHHDIQLTLSKTYQREAVSRFGNLRLLPADEAISPQTDILDIFEKNGRSLLILGAPASGKTITLLQLADALLEEAQLDYRRPIPVILNLSSWGGQQLPLDEWIVEELFLQQQTARPLSRQWLNEYNFTFLLDGLDEVVLSARDKCVASINQFKAEHPANLVVCSRIDDYQALSTQLNLPTAISLQPLTLVQIDDYLSQFGDNLIPLRKSLSEDKDWQELARSPLMLSLMALAYDKSVPQFGDTINIQERYHHLFTAYTQRVFDHRPLASDSYDQIQAMTWLTNLAHGLTQHGNSIFYIERLQKTWLASIPSYRLYRMLSGSVGGALAGLLIAIIGGVFIWGINTCCLYGFFYNGLFLNGAYDALIGMTFFGLTIGLFIGWSDNQFLYQLNRFYNRESTFNAWLLLGLIGGLFLSLVGLDKRDFDSYHNINVFLFKIGGGVIGSFAGAFTVGFLDSGNFAPRNKIVQGIVQLISNIYDNLIQRSQRRILTVENVTLRKPTLVRFWQQMKGEAKDGFWGGLVLGWTISFVHDLDIIIRNMDRVTERLASSLMDGLLVGVLSTLLFGILGGINAFVHAHQSNEPLQPNQGIRATRRTMYRIGFPFALIYIIVGFGVCLGLEVILLIDRLWFLCLLGFIGLLRYGGVTLLRHYLLRIRLTRQKILPFSNSDKKLSTYLDDMVDHLLLRRVGGGWIFIHRYLQEYFASQHPDVGQPLPPSPELPDLVSESGLKT